MPRNKRATARFEYRGQMLDMASLAELSEFPYATIRQRLRNGWSAERAIHEPLNTSKWEKRKRRQS